MNRTLPAPRLAYRTLEPAAYDALRALDAYVRGTGLDARLLELIKVRASALNGCAFCVDLHTRDALKVGVPQQQLSLLPVWHEAGEVFSPRERAVLAFTDAVTRLAEGGVPDDIVEALRAHFADQAVVQLTMAVTAIGAWNRMGVVSGLRPAVQE